MGSVEEVGGQTMKILKNDDVEYIECLTTALFDSIHNLTNDSIKTPFFKIEAIRKINRIRATLDLPMIIQNHSCINGMPTLNIKPPIKEECKHNFELLPIGENKQAILYCRHCAEVKRISLYEQAEQKRTQAQFPQIPKGAIFMPIALFEYICDESVYAHEVKEKVRDHRNLEKQLFEASLNGTQEDKQ